eukprot:3399294-Prymnesium_polylepis.1
MANESFFEPERLARHEMTTSTEPAGSAVASAAGSHTSASTSVAPSNLGSDAALPASRVTAAVG